MSILSIIFYFGLVAFLVSIVCAYLDTYDDLEEAKDEPLPPYKPPPPETQAPEAKQKFYTRYQTSQVFLHDEPSEMFHSLDYVPIPPPDLPTGRKRDFMAVNTPDGTQVRWFTDGTVTVEDPYATMIFHPPPSLQEAVKKSPFGDGCFYKFKSDGSTIVRQYDRSFYYGPLVEGEPQLGDIVEIPEF